MSNLTKNFKCLPSRQRALIAWWKSRKSSSVWESNLDKEKTKKRRIIIIMALIWVWRIPRTFWRRSSSMICSKQLPEQRMTWHQWCVNLSRVWELLQVTFSYPWMSLICMLSRACRTSFLFWAQSLMNTPIYYKLTSRWSRGQGSLQVKAKILMK